MWKPKPGDEQKPPYDHGRDSDNDERERERFSKRIVGSQRQGQDQEKLSERGQASPQESADHGLGF